MLFGFDVLKKNALRKGRNISQNRTLLDISKYAAAGETRADMQSKVEELEQLNQAIMNRDKLKDDAIAHLSDTYLTLEMFRNF